MKNHGLSILCLILSGILSLACSRFYQEEHQKLQEKILNLKILLKENQAIVDAIPRFEKEVQLTCNFEKRRILEFRNENNPKETPKASGVNLPQFYQDIPSNGRQTELVVQYMFLQGKIFATHSKIAYVEKLRNLNRKCKQQKN